MRILFDQGTPVPLPQSLSHHEVETAYEREWSKLENGQLLDAAEKHGFEVLITTDSNLQYQQNLISRRIAIIVLSTPSWLRIKRSIADVIGAVEAASEGSFRRVEIP